MVNIASIDAMTRALFLICFFLIGTSPFLASRSAARNLPSPRSIATEALLFAYPDQFDLNEQNDLVWRDGSAIDWGVVTLRATATSNLKQASLADQFDQIYPTIDQNVSHPMLNDPGRLRNELFFKKMYGDCTKAPLHHKLATVIWLPQTAPQNIQVTTINGVHLALQRVSSRIETLPDSLRAPARNLQGSFVCRKIKGTSATSMHAYGAAIDFHSSTGRYWRWSKIDQHNTKGDKIPQEIIQIFEDEGFIWGGRWRHVDSIHFEYRPELIRFSKIWNSLVERYLTENPM